MKKFLLISKKITNYMLLVMAIVYMIMILPMSVFMDYCKYNKFLENIKHNQHIGIVVSKNMKTYVSENMELTKTYLLTIKLPNKNMLIKTNKHTWEILQKGNQVVLFIKNGKITNIFPNKQKLYASKKNLLQVFKIKLVLLLIVYVLILGAFLQFRQKIFEKLSGRES